MKTEMVDYHMSKGRIKRVTYRVEEKGLLEGLRTPIKAEIIKEAKK